MYLFDLSFFFCRNYDWIHEFSSDIHFLPLISLCSFHVYILLSEIQLHPLTKVHSVKCLRQDGTVWQLYKESQSEETTFSCIGLISRKYYAYWAKNSWLDTVAMIFLSLMQNENLGLDQKCAELVPDMWKTGHKMITTLGKMCRTRIKNCKIRTRKCAELFHKCAELK